MPLILYGWQNYESWTVKKAEFQRIDAFKLLWWRRLLRVPWTARRSSQSSLKEISPEYSLEGLMLKLKLQYFGHLMWGTDSLEKTLMLGRIEGRRRRGDRRWDGWMASPTRRAWVWASSGSWWWKGRPGVLQSVGLQNQMQLGDWTTTNVLRTYSSVSSVSRHSFYGCYTLLWLYCQLRLRRDQRKWENSNHPQKTVFIALAGYMGDFLFVFLKCSCNFCCLVSVTNRQLDLYRLPQTQV